MKEEQQAMTEEDFRAFVAANVVLEDESGRTSLPNTNEGVGEDVSEAFGAFDQVIPIIIPLFVHIPFPI